MWYGMLLHCILKTEATCCVYTSILSSNCRCNCNVLTMHLQFSRSLSHMMFLLRAGTSTTGQTIEHRSSRRRDSSSPEVSGERNQRGDREGCVYVESCTGAG